jgi:hypothetical protein
MIKAYKHKINGSYTVIDWRQGKVYARQDNLTLQKAKQLKKQWQNNEYRRAQNEVLRDLCGTSARAARLDMGL